MGKNIQQHGFSDGYRSAYFDGVIYVFTKKQAVNNQINSPGNYHQNSPGAI
jgi:hypothetical protein